MVMAANTFTSIEFYLNLTIPDFLEYLELMDELHKK